jgi:hypothetical protein
MILYGTNREIKIQFFNHEPGQMLVYFYHDTDLVTG